MKEKLRVAHLRPRTPLDSQDFYSSLFSSCIFSFLFYQNLCLPLSRGAEECIHFHEQIHISLNSKKPIHQCFRSINFTPGHLQPHLSGCMDGQNRVRDLPLSELTLSSRDGKEHFSSSLAGKVKLDIGRETSGSFR